jgi:hypothetical protein
MKFPGRSQREADQYGPAWGAKLEADRSREGFVDDGLIAWPERIVDARRQWLEAQPDDFEQVGKRLYRDKASGIEYRHVSGSPLLTIGAPGSEGVSVFFVHGGKLVFLRWADLPIGTSVNHGPIIAMQLPTYAGPTNDIY